MGIRKPIPRGGLFPAALTTASITSEALLDAEVQPNHGSFSRFFGEEGIPGDKVVAEHVDNGYGFLFASADEAVKFSTLRSPQHLCGT